jgi:sterol desaturase/sphingolipid hydroxylase (fatty acid hydroxylase superfamily)
MQPLLIEILRLSLWLAVLVAIFIPLERFLAVQPHNIFRKGIWTDLGYYFLNGLVPVLLLSVLIGPLAWAAHQAIPAGFLAVMADQPLWARVLVGLVVGEVGYYWGHRWTHEVPFLWRFHSIHHSAEHVDFLVNTRAHPVDMVFSRFCGLVPIYLLGLGGPVNLAGSQVPVLATLIAMTWGFFIHANVRWRFGPLEWLISTPAFHHWHHTKTGPINHNYASTLPWLDRIFGTHYLPRAWPSSYGIEAKLPDSLTEQLAYPLFPQRSPVAPENQSVPEITAAAGEKGMDVSPTSEVVKTS